MLFLVSSRKGQLFCGPELIRGHDWVQNAAAKKSLRLLQALQ